MIRWIRSRTTTDDAHDLSHHERDADTADPVRQDWDRLRTEATTPGERAEIDAIFSRYAA